MAKVNFLDFSNLKNVHFHRPPSPTYRKAGYRPDNSSSFMTHPSHFTEYGIKLIYIPKINIYSKRIMGHCKTFSYHCKIIKILFLACQNTKLI